MPRPYMPGASFRLCVFLGNIHIPSDLVVGPNLAKTKILAKDNAVNQVDRLHGGTKPAHAVWE